MKAYKPQIKLDYPNHRAKSTLEINQTIRKQFKVALDNKRDPILEGEVPLFTNPKRVILIFF